MRFKYVRIQGRELAENTMYADEYQVAVKAGYDLIIESVQPSWSDEHKKK